MKRIRTKKVRGISTYTGGETTLHAHYPTPVDFDLKSLKIVNLRKSSGGFVHDQDVFGQAMAMGSDLTSLHAERLLEHLKTRREWEYCYVLLMGELFSDRHSSFSVYVICPPEGDKTWRVELKQMEFVTGALFSGNHRIAMPIVKRVCCRKG